MFANLPSPKLQEYSDAFSKIEKSFLRQRSLIEDWLQKQWALTLPPIYGSVDLRNAGFKLAPIDMNLFPAGFNNLNPEHMSLSIAAAKKIVNQLSAAAKNILVIPESHTRNLFYWVNIKTLQNVLEQAGFVVRFATLDNDDNDKNIQLNETESITIEALTRDNDHLKVKDFIPDIILLNNDLSEGIPKVLQNLKQQIIPPAELGWSQRLKSEHFAYYADVAAEFAKVADIDPWLISPLFRHCGKIDFMQQSGLECVTKHATALFDEIKKKYVEYGITKQPFLIIKADAGTYGMAVMTIRNVEELTNLNRKQRTRMSMTKGNQPVDKVIIQEGVYTFESVGEPPSVAEPVVYLWGSDVVGGFYRVHRDRSNDENLNSPGMRFEPMAFSKPCHEPCPESDPNHQQNRFYTYGVVAKLSMLAAAREIEAYEGVNK